MELCDPSTPYVEENGSQTRVSSERAGKHSAGFPEVSVDQKYSPQLCGALRIRLGLLLKCSTGGGVGCHLASRQTERRFGQTELTWEGYQEHRIPYCTCNSILGRV